MSECNEKSNPQLTRNESIDVPCGEEAEDLSVAMVSATH